MPQPHHHHERRRRPHIERRSTAVSTRLLYLVFEEDGDAVHAYVRRRRVARARADLVRPGRRPTVAGLASRWGFADGTALARAFRAQYGVLPSEVGPGRPGAGGVADTAPVKGADEAADGADDAVDLVTEHAYRRS